MSRGVYKWKFYSSWKYKPYYGFNSADLPVQILGYLLGKENTNDVQPSNTILQDGERFERGWNNFQVDHRLKEESHSHRSSLQLRPENYNDYSLGYPNGTF